MFLTGVLSCALAGRMMKTSLGDGPLFSIITPSYNQGALIEKTITSVLSQEYPYIEHIIVDGGSTDNTIDVLKKYDDKISWVSEQDKGQSDALNKGFKKAGGDIIGWVNSDDIYLPGAFKKVVDYFQKNPHIKIVHGAGYYIRKDDSVIRPYYSDPRIHETLADSFNICQPALFIKKEVLDDIGFVNPNLHYCMDYELIIRISKKYNIGYLNDYLAALRYYVGAKSSDYQSMYDEVAAVQKKYFGVVSFNHLFAYYNEIIKSKLGGGPGPGINLLAMFPSFYGFIKSNKKIPFLELLSWFQMKRRLKRYTCFR